MSFVLTFYRIVYCYFNIRKMIALAKTIYRREQVPSDAKDLCATGQYDCRFLEGFDLSEGSMDFYRTILPMLDPESKHRQSKHTLLSSGQH